MIDIAKNILLKFTRKCLAQRIKITVAESCTGGQLSTLLTSLPGSSAWFDCGFVTYSNQSKHAMLNVALQVIDSCGAVSQEVAVAMAVGALANSSANLALAMTGIAGPAGGSDLKPVGTVWFAIAQQDRTTITTQRLFKHA